MTSSRAKSHGDVPQAVMRIWRTEIDVLRAAEYRHFAQHHSLPMFRSHEGFLGVVFAEAGPERFVVTFWRDAASVDKLNYSARYRETVRRIEQTRLLIGTSSVDCYEIDQAAFEGFWWTAR